MANFDQNVTIDIDVDTDGVASGLTTVVSELEATESALDGMDARVNGLRNSMEEFHESSSKAFKNLEPEVDMSGISQEDAEKLEALTSTYQDLGDAMEKVEEQKQEVSDANEIVDKRNKQTAESTQDEADSFRDALGSARTLAEAKKAAANSNKILNDSAKKTANDGVLDEIVKLNDLDVTVEELKEKLGLLSDEQKNLDEDNKNTSKSLGLERDTVGELSEGMDGLAGAKRAAANANRKLGKDGDETVDILSDEFDISKKNARSILGMAESSNSASRASRRLRGSLDETTDSMRAANKVGGLFEDGLGSLSVNLGAFTVALRNFLTQVPLLLAGLGSLGAAALGVASAFAVAGTAIGGAIGAGALAMAQGLEEEYSKIENTGEALQVMMAGMRDMFEEALSPLTENAATMEVFEQVIVGVAHEVSLLADTISNIMTAQDDWADGVKGVQGVVDDLGEQLDGPMNDVMVQFTKMFKQLQDEFIAISVGFVEAFAGMLEFTRKFADGIDSLGKTLDQFFDTLKEMAQVGKDVLGGLKPVFIAFSGVMQNVASALNSMNSEFVANIVTFLAIGAAINKLFGFFSGIIGIIPNFIAAVVGANGSVTALSNSMLSFLNENNAMISGITAFGEALEDAGEEMDIFRARSELTENSFRALGDVQAKQLRHTLNNTESMEEFEEQLIDSAMASDITSDRLDALNDELDEMQLETIQSKAALESLDDTNVSPDVERDVALGGAGAGVAASEAADGTDEAAGALDRVKKKAGNAKGALTGLFSSGIIGAIKTLGGKITMIAGKIATFAPPIAALVALIGGVLVGLIGNLDAVMSGLSKTMNILGGIFSWLANELIGVFIGVWNALVDVVIGLFMVIKPIIDIFKSLLGSSEDTAGAMGMLVDAIEYVLDLGIALLEAFGAIVRILGTVVGGIISMLIPAILLAISPLEWFINTLLWAIDTLQKAWKVMTQGEGPLSSVTEWIEQLIWTLMNLPKVIKITMNAMLQFFQDAFNKIIYGINDFIAAVNDIPGISFGFFDTVDFGIGGGEGVAVDRDEVSEGTDQMFGGAAGERKSEITFNEDNSTNIDQTVNADPEDQAQLSRVVTDAIAEANSFERRRQGGQ